MAAGTLTLNTAATVQQIDTLVELDNTELAGITFNLEDAAATLADVDNAVVVKAAGALTTTAATVQQINTLVGLSQTVVNLDESSATGAGAADEGTYTVRVSEGTNSGIKLELVDDGDVVVSTLDDQSPDGADEDGVFVFADALAGDADLTVTFNAAAQTAASLQIGDEAEIEVDENGDATVGTFTPGTAIHLAAITFNLTDAAATLADVANAEVVMAAGTLTLNTAATVQQIDTLVELDNTELAGITFNLNDSLENIQAASAELLNSADVVTVNGTAGNDDINFSALSVDLVVIAGAGNDVIRTGSGADVIRPGAGNDVIFGGDGDDIMQVELGDLGGRDLSSSNIFRDFNSSGDDTLDLQGFVFKSLGGAALDGDVWGSDVFVPGVSTFDGVELSSAELTDTTILYKLQMTGVTNFNSEQNITSAVDAVIEVGGVASDFFTAANASVLIQVIGSDGNDVALFHFVDTDGVNGIAADELQLIGIFRDSDPLTAGDIII